MRDENGENCWWERKYIGPGEGTNDRSEWVANSFSGWIYDDTRFSCFIFDQQRIPRGRSCDQSKYRCFLPILFCTTLDASPWLMGPQSSSDRSCSFLPILHSLHSRSLRFLSKSWSKQWNKIPHVWGTINAQKQGMLPPPKAFSLASKPAHMLEADPQRCRFPPRQLNDVVAERQGWRARSLGFRV
jgi:hypothetical protein